MEEEIDINLNNRTINYQLARFIKFSSVPSIHNIFLMALFDKDVGHRRNQIQLGGRIFQKVYGRYSVYIFVLSL